MVAVDASFGSATGSRTQISWMKTKRTSRYSIAPFIKPIFKDQYVEFHLLNHSTKHIIQYVGFFVTVFYLLFLDAMVGDGGVEPP